MGTHGAMSTHDVSTIFAVAALVHALRVHTHLLVHPLQCPEQPPQPHLHINIRLTVS